MKKAVVNVWNAEIQAVEAFNFSGRELQVVLGEKMLSVRNWEDGNTIGWSTFAEGEWSSVHYSEEVKEWQTLKR